MRPNANEIDTKTVECTWPTPEFCVGTQRNLYSIGLCLGFASGKTQLLGFTLGKTQNIMSPNARDTNMLVFFALGNAKVVSFVLADAKVPNTSSFAPQWNIIIRRPASALLDKLLCPPSPGGPAAAG